MKSNQFLTLMVLTPLVCGLAPRGLAAERPAGAPPTLRQWSASMMGHSGHHPRRRSGRALYGVAMAVQGWREFQPVTSFR